jgi:hypothetical protein
MAIQTKNAKERFVYLKSVVAAGQAVWFITSMALAEIKANEFWKLDGHESFAAFCDKEYGWTKRYCDQLCLDASVVKELPENMRKLLETESSARALSQVPPILRVAVVNAATSNGAKPATAKAIKAATPVPLKLKAKSTPPPAKKSKPVIAPKIESIKDETGTSIPSALLHLWERRDEVKELLMYIRSVKSVLTSRKKSEDAMYKAVDYNNAFAALSQADASISLALPYAVCPTCLGKVKEGCGRCNQTGFISQFAWDNTVDEDSKKMRAKLAEAA